MSRRKEKQYRKAGKMVANGDLLEMSNGSIIAQGSRRADGLRRFHRLWPVDDARLWECDCEWQQHRRSACSHAIAAEMYVKQEAARVRALYEKGEVR